jgi:hypothetical protein
VPASVEPVRVAKTLVKRKAMRTQLTRLMLPILVTLGAMLAGEISLAGGRLHGGGGFNSAIYPVPHPVPPLVGPTPYNYQPLYPHEMLHKHYHVWRRYDGGRLIPSTTTRALYW